MSREDAPPRCTMDLVKAASSSLSSSTTTTTMQRSSSSSSMSMTTVSNNTNTNYSGTGTVAGLHGGNYYDLTHCDNDDHYHYHAPRHTIQNNNVNLQQHAQKHPPVGHHLRRATAVMDDRRAYGRTSTSNTMVVMATAQLSSTSTLKSNNQPMQMQPQQQQPQRNNNTNNNNICVIDLVNSDNEDETTDEATEAEADDGSSVGASSSCSSKKRSLQMLQRHISLQQGRNRNRNAIAGVGAGGSIVSSYNYNSSSSNYTSNNCTNNPSSSLSSTTTNNYASMRQKRSRIQQHPQQQHHHQLQLQHPQVPQHQYQYRYNINHNQQQQQQPYQQQQQQHHQQPLISKNTQHQPPLTTTTATQTQTTQLLLHLPSQQTSDGAQITFGLLSLIDIIMLQNNNQDHHHRNTKDYNTRTHVRTCEGSVGMSRNKLFAPVDSIIGSGCGGGGDRDGSAGATGGLMSLATATSAEAEAAILSTSATRTFGGEQQLLLPPTTITNIPSTPPNHHHHHIQHHHQHQQHYYYNHQPQHYLQNDGWSCGYRNLQMLLSSMMPCLSWAFLVENEKRKDDGGLRVPVRVPCIGEIQRDMELLWQAGFDARNAEHHGHSLVGKKTWIGTVEVWSYLSFKRIDSIIIQFIKTQSNRVMLGKFVWAYFNRICGPFGCSCSGTTNNEGGCHRAAGNGRNGGNHCQYPLATPLLTSTEYAAHLLRECCGSNDNHTAMNEVGGGTVQQQQQGQSGTCECSIPPLYLQWEGHSVTIVGVRKIADQNKFNLLIFCPQKAALHNYVKQMLTNELKQQQQQRNTSSGSSSSTECSEKLASIIELPTTKLLEKDCQILLSTGRRIDDQERNLRRKCTKNVGYLDAVGSSSSSAYNHNQSAHE